MMRKCVAWQPMYTFWVRLAVYSRIAKVTLVCVCVRVFCYIFSFDCRSFRPGATRRMRNLHVSLKSRLATKRERWLTQLWLLLLLLAMFCLFDAFCGSSHKMAAAAAMATMILCPSYVLFRLWKVSSIYFMAAPHSHCHSYDASSCCSCCCNFNVFESPSTTRPLFMCMWLCFVAFQNIWKGSSESFILPFLFLIAHWFKTRKKWHFQWEKRNVNVDLLHIIPKLWRNHANGFASRRQLQSEMCWANIKMDVTFWMKKKAVKCKKVKE